MTKSPAAKIAALAAFVRELLLIAATLIAGAELVNPGAVHDMHAPSLAEERTHHAARRKLFGWIGSERTSAVQRALPAICWEIFPIGTDGIWPAEAVREVIDDLDSKPIFDGFWIGRRNRRGITTRMPRDGGKLERDEAAKYRKFAAALAYEHPRTAKALDSLADSYEEEARRHDENAERLDWEP